MNQARKRTGTKKVLSMILVLVMLLSLLSMAAFTLPAAASSDSAASNADFMRIFHLDCGRKYFSVAEIEGIIDQLSANHYTHLQLAFGNNGFRFLLNDMSVGSYTSDNVKSALTNGNNTYSNSKGADTSILSESDMNKIIKYATEKGISIIPMLNTPGHMDALVSAMKALNVGSKSDSEMSLTDDAQVNFVKALQQKYINYFAAKGSKYYNIAADEYTFSALSDSEYTAFATYVNAIAKMVKGAGMTPMCYNDGINYSGKTTSVAFDTDILVCYWAQDANYASVTKLSNAGFKIINNNDAWYYVLDDYLNIWAKPQWRYEDALKGIRSTPVTQAKNVADKEVPVVGSVLCVWCDGPDRSFPANREKVYNLIKAMADANPAYFTDAVKLPATDTADQVSVVVTGTKGQTATVDAEPVTSSYTFDAFEAENVASYNVTPKVNGTVYSAQGTVTLPVPAGWVQDASRIRAYIIDNGAVKLLSGTLADGKYTFDVPHFSEMGLLQVDATVVPISVAEGKTVQKTVNGNQTVVDKSQLDETIATVTTESKSAGKTLKEVTSIESGKEYLIYNQRYEGVLTNGSVKSEWNNCLKLVKAQASADNANVWTITASGSNYSIADKNGNYLTIGKNAASVGTTKANITLTYNQTNGYWNISQNSCYLNNLGETNNAGGWKWDKNKNNAPTDSGSKWTIYQIVEEASDSTTISFTGVKAGGTTYVTVGDTTYKITVTEKQTVEIPISIVDYRADGLLFDFQVGGATYDYGLVHTSNETVSVNSNGGTLDGTEYGTKISGTTLENTGYIANEYWSGVYYSWGNKWSRSGMVESKLGSNGMPVYTNATVVRVAQELAKGNYNSGEMANVTNSNKVIYDTFIASGKVVNSETTKMSDAFSAHKSWDNITNAYDLAWYLLNTLYQADTNTTTVTDAKGVSHTVPIYGMAVNAYDSIILTENNGVYSFDAANGKSHYDTNSRSIYEDDSVNTLQFYPIDGLGYDAILGDTTDKTDTPTTKDSDGNITTVRPENPNGSYALRGEAQFIYRDDLYFEFSGDDDVYMYINGVLALDLGGAHGICTKRVNLKDVAQQCHLTEGEVATFTFFYMERNSDASNFKIETNMELVKRGISVQKNAYDAGYANEIMSGTAVETGRSVYYDLVVTNQSNALMNHICFNDTDKRGGIASFGFGVANAAVTAGTTNTNGTVSLGAAGTYEIYVTDANNAEVAGTRRTFSSLSELSAAVAGVSLQPGQSLHVRFLTATFAVKESKILNYVNTVRVTAAVGSQQLSDEATNELYSYNANDTSKTYVVDFGLPLQITGIFDSGARDNVGDVKLNDSNTLKYGTVDLTPDGYNSSLVYTRTDDKAINDAETIVLDVTYKMGKSNVTLQKTLTIIPATTVYYEDSFATFSGNWTPVGTTEENAVQNLDELGKTGANNYGYDAQYNKSSTYSLGSAMKTTVSSNTNSNPPKATFIFKGTGFDLVSMTSKDTGTILVNVVGKDSEGNSVTKNWIVDTFYGYTRTQEGYIQYTWTKGEDGKWHNKAVKIKELPEGATTGGTPEQSNVTYEPNYIWTAAGEGDNALYQIPVIHYTDLPYGEYTVTVTPKYSSSRDYYQADANDNSYDFYLDGVRIYNPAGDKLNSQYVKDGEGYAQFTEIRNMLLSTSGLTANIQPKTGVVFVDGVGDKGTLADYTNYGPNNEVYLSKGQAIAFKISDMNNVDSIQIGAKAPNGNATMQIKVGNNEPQEQNLTTASDMYYKLKNVQADQTIVITNTSDSLLSLTTLKVTYKNDPSASNSADPVVDEEVVAQAPVMLMSMLYGEPQTFEPDHFTAKWSRNVRKGGTATLTVKASADVESITVDGQPITTYTTKTARSVWGAKETYHVFTYRVTNAATATYSICAVNADGVASDPITAPLTVRPSIRDWWNGIFDKWKH